MKRRRLRMWTMTMMLSLLSVIHGACHSSSAQSSSGGQPEGAYGERLNPAEVSIYAAAGTRLVTDELCDDWEKSRQVTVVRNYASSGTLARQIAAGAKADVFVSANRQWIDFLQDKGLLKPESVRVIARNALVFIAPKKSRAARVDAVSEYPIASRIEHMAIGDPSYVPVGRYTDEAFRKLGWSDSLAGKLILAKDVSSVLHYVALGECDLGVVYWSEAMQSKKVTVVGKVPASLHKPILFYVAQLKFASNSPLIPELAHQFSSDSKDVFVRHGFLPVDDSEQ